MGRYTPNIQPLVFEIQEKEAQVRAQEAEWALALTRLEGLEVTDTTKAMFQRFVNGEVTVTELNAAIDEYLDEQDLSAPPSES